MDTTCTGLIKLEPIANFLKQYKEGTATEWVEQGKFEEKIFHFHLQH